MLAPSPLRPCARPFALPLGFPCSVCVLALKPKVNDGFPAKNGLPSFGSSFSVVADSYRRQDSSSGAPSSRGLLPPCFVERLFPFGLNLLSPTFFAAVVPAVAISLNS